MNVMCNVMYTGTLPPDWGSAVAFQSLSELSVGFNHLSGAVCAEAIRSTFALSWARHSAAFKHQQCASVLDSILMQACCFDLVACTACFINEGGGPLMHEMACFQSLTRTAGCCHDAYGV